MEENKPIYESCGIPNEKVMSDLTYPFALSLLYNEMLRPHELYKFKYAGPEIPFSAYDYGAFRYFKRESTLRRQGFVNLIPHLNNPTFGAKLELPDRQVPLSVNTIYCILDVAETEHIKMSEVRFNGSLKNVARELHRNIFMYNEYGHRACNVDMKITLSDLRQIKIINVLRHKPTPFVRQYYVLHAKTGISLYKAQRLLEPDSFMKDYGISPYEMVKALNTALQDPDFAAKFNRRVKQLIIHV
ncbi:MAG: hypothetical protein JRN10_00230 [Nitrososphaerota archaeon]|jgi:hypothetical protein|nr:hypothetical protein [Nitrososphaerota archaeon]MDG6929664.1 hypothetical protein [Nitrososphaerota archaeon]